MPTDPTPPRAPLDLKKLEDWKAALAEIEAARKRGRGRWAPGQERAAEAAAYRLAEEALEAPCSRWNRARGAR